MILSEIWIYPVKSLSGIRLTEAQVEEKGLQYDRRWMITDLNGRFITQREHTVMAMLKVAVLENGLLISSRLEEGKSILIPFEPVTNNPVSVVIWDDEVEALTVSDEADQWLSKQLNLQVQLVMMPESTQRKADPHFAGFAGSFK
jgi:uncharacterized protein YcbX